MKRIVLAGGSGLVGQALKRYFHNAGWDVVILTRSPQLVTKKSNEPVSEAGVILELAWDARRLGAWQQHLEGATAVVNLTGKSVNCRYHARNRKEILDSRVDSTRVIGEAIRNCAKPPRVWLNASTATIYKHTFGPAHDEQGEIGAAAEAKDAFSIEVAEAWERAWSQADTPGTRKVALRSAMVLALGKNSVFPVLRRLVRLGLGGKMGHGRQFVSWIHAEDFCRAIDWIISHDELSGPINVAAPNPVPNREMMQILREVCGVPFGLPAPGPLLEPGAFFLRTETELIIKSRRVIPRRLIESGFEFRFPKVRHAFEDLASAPGNTHQSASGCAADDSSPSPHLMGREPG